MGKLESCDKFGFADDIMLMIEDAIELKEMIQERTKDTHSKYEDQNL